MGHDDDRNEMINPYWMSDKALTKGEVDFISPTELVFWDELIEKYLRPLEKNNQEQVKNIYHFEIWCLCDPIILVFT